MGRILVTGAAGFIGSHVVERLLLRGDKVLGIDNFDPNYDIKLKWRNAAAALNNPDYRLCQADFTNLREVKPLFDEFAPDSVIHIGAKAGVRPSFDDPTGYIETNVRGTVNLLQLSAHRASHFVLASSSSVYGERSRVPFSEADSTEAPISPYAASKKACEHFGHVYHQTSGLSVTCLRFFTTYGPRQRPDLAINKFASLIESDQPIPVFGDGTTSRDYVFIDDLVDGICAALDRPGRFEVYNLGGGRPVALKNVVRHLGKAMGKRPKIDQLPVQPGDVSITYADTAKAREQLGFRAKI